MLACKSGNLEHVKLLLDAGADVKKVEDDVSIGSAALFTKNDWS